MPGLTPDQFVAGRQIKRDSKTFDVLDVVQGQAGNSFALLKSGDTTELVPVADFRDDDSKYESVSHEDAQANREAAASGESSSSRSSRSSSGSKKSGSSGSQKSGSSSSGSSGPSSSTPPTPSKS